MDYKVDTPQILGIYHIICILAVIALSAFLIVKFKNTDEKTVRIILLVASLTTIAFEIYKQFIFGITVDGTAISYDYAWYAFPFQFCSTPMYLQLLAALIPSKKIRHMLCAYLATYALLAGLIVMLYPGDVFISTAGINLQTMVCHGLMTAVGAFLLVRYIRLEHKTILHAMGIFGVVVIIAMALNEAAFFSGIIGDETFNMMFISPHFDCTLPILSEIYKAVPYPVFFMIYIFAFSLAAYIILLAAMGMKAFVRLHRHNKKPKESATV